jgi:tRNA dimethylallyltransferase
MADTPPQPSPHCSPTRNAERAPRHPPSSIPQTRPIFLAGPTAVGKSAIALTLAEKIGGEIITVDSMQVYRGLDIGTAKPTAAERRRVPHHLLDVCDLNEAFDAAQFMRLAEKAVAEIQARGHVPIFCGGTGLYFKAFLEGLGESPATNPELRAELESAPFEALLRELRERDPAAYEKIDKQNPRRVFRAVEVIRLTGKKFSEQRAEWKPSRTNEDGGSRMEDGGDSKRPSSILHPPSSPIFCFTRPADDLHRRINTRVDEMFARGLVEETRELLKRGLEQNKFAMQAIGYRQVAEHLRGERGLAETVELVKIKTRKYAKKQMTWYRRHGRCEWLELNSDTTPESVLARLVP